ncbi:MAG: DUF47 family protein, partial [Solirubrobacteraceae bacterium]
MGFLRRSADPILVTLVENAGSNILRSGLLLREQLAELPERSGLAEELKSIEQEGDRITHDIINRLNGGGRRLRLPFDAGDGYALATALDDVIDHTEQTAALLHLYGVEAPMEQAVELADVLVGADEQIVKALERLGTGAEPGP